MDAKAITFQITQASQIVVNPDGSLVAKIGKVQFPPKISLTAPGASQATPSGQETRGVSFVVQSTTTFGLVAQSVDTSLPLEISMQLSSGSLSTPIYLSSSTLWASDATGNTYVAVTAADPAVKDGPFAGIGGTGCGNNIDQPYACWDVAIYKYSAAGAVDFITYLAGRASENPGFVGIAPNGSLVVAGTTDSSDFPVTAGAFQSNYAGPPAQPNSPNAPLGDFFAATLDPATLTLQASTFLGGPNGDVMGTAALGEDGSLYFLPMAPSGSFSADMPVTSGALQSSCQGDPCTNGYVAHLSPALDKLLYGTYLPGTLQATAQLYSDGSVYYGGEAQAGFPTTPGAYQPQNAGGDDGIVARLDPTGSQLLFGTYFGGPNTDWVVHIAVAPDGSVWAHVLSFVQCCVDVDDRLIHRDASGTKLLANPPFNLDEVVVDKAGNVFVLAQGSFTTSPGALLSSSCGNDAYVELSPSGQQVFATYLPPSVGGFDGADAQGTPYLDTAFGGRVQVVQDQAAGTLAGCLVDAAGFGNPQIVSPGAIVSIFGSGLGPSKGAGFQLQNGQLPTTLGGTKVLVNGDPAPLLYSSDTQLNLILPYSLSVGSIPSIQVVSNGTSAIQMPASVVDQGVTIFRVNNAAAALNQDGTVNSPENPARPGSTVALFGTGGGQTSPASVAGGITPLGLFTLVATPRMQVPQSSTPVTVKWAGAAPGLVSGVTQINVALPDVIPDVPGYPKGTLPLQVIETGSSFDSGIVTISVARN